MHLLVFFFPLKAIASAKYDRPPSELPCIDAGVCTDFLDFLYNNKTFWLCDAPARPCCFRWRCGESAKCGHHFLSCHGLMQVCQSTGCLEFLYKGKKNNLLAFRCLLSPQSVSVLRNGKFWIKCCRSWIWQSCIVPEIIEKTIWQIFCVSCSKEILWGWHIPCEGKGLHFVLLLSLLKSLRLCSKLTCRNNWHCNREVRGTMRDNSLGFCG